MQLKIYDVSVRHAGNLGHEIPKSGVSNIEITLLRRIHGEDAVVNIKQIGARDVESEQDEYFRLARHYTRQKVERAFNTVLDGFERWLEAQVEVEHQQIAARAEERQKKFGVDMAEQQIRDGEAARERLVEQQAATRPVEPSTARAME